MNFSIHYLGEDSSDYNGNQNTASESIVIKIDANDKITAKSTLVDKSKNGKQNNDDTVTERSIIIDATTHPTAGRPIPSSTASHRTENTPPPTTSMPIIPNYNYNSASYYYAKDDMSIYDDVNNNRLNLHSNTGHINAFEERNIYVTNNGLSDGRAGDNGVSSSRNNDSAKSYIHIEVFKGNLDAMSTKKPKYSTPRKSDTQQTNGNAARNLSARNTDNTAKVSTPKS